MPGIRIENKAAAGAPEGAAKGPKKANNNRQRNGGGQGAGSKDGAAAKPRANNANKGPKPAAAAPAPKKELTPEEVEAQAAAKKAADEKRAKAKAEEEARAAAAAEAARLRAEEAAALKKAEEEEKARVAKLLADFMAATPAKLAGDMLAAGVSKGEGEAQLQATIAYSETPGKDGKVRAQAAKVFGELAKQGGEAAAPVTVTVLLPRLLVLLDDKDKKARDAADEAVKAVATCIRGESIRAVLPSLFAGMANEAKWRAKVAVLEMLTGLIVAHDECAARCLPEILPQCHDPLWDSKDEVTEAALATIKAVCGVVQNPDVQPFVPDLISAMRNTNEVPECIQKLASTTFVKVVDAAALAVIVPLMIRGFGTNKTVVMRQCCVIISNMAKLVSRATECSPFLADLMPQIERATETISDPEARSVAEKTLVQMKRVEADAAALATLSKETVAATVAEVLPAASAAAAAYMTDVCMALIDLDRFEVEEWQEALGPLAGGADAAAKLLEDCLRHRSEQADGAEQEEDGEVLCDCTFTLAYGSKVLLHNTPMKLRKGKKYGLLGGNDSGKSTLMRAIAEGKVDGFPPADELRAVYVEADIQGEMSHLAVLEYVFEDERIQACGVSREQVREVLLSVGFTEKMCVEPITSLSGGWRMKLALARAMIQKADLLLLDEPTNHLDVLNVKWVEDYLNSLTDVTCVMVSHDPSLLTNCCSNILRIQDLKLKPFVGNLTEFVKVNPDAQSFFELKTDKLVFKFPQPGFLQGVKSKGRALMKMDDVTFTYPSNDTPTVNNATVRVSLSSRVACLGVNGAGKSTLIKLLTGELEPSKGTVWTHEGARIAYVAQHAFHHIENHLTKTANEYIRWRYQDGEDKEGLSKASMVLTDEDLAKCAEPILVDGVDPKTGKERKEKRVIDKLSGSRRATKRTFEYEVCFKGMTYDQNRWLQKEDLERAGFTKHVKQTDMKVEAAEGMYKRPLTQVSVEKHLEDLGLDREFGTHNRMAALSGGQKVKVVLAAAMWNNPHVVILDEPTNYLARDALAALAGAIKEFEGGIVIITHNAQFASTLCPETWVMEHGILDVQGDAEWMANAMKTKTEFKVIEEMTDGLGNKVKVKGPKVKLSRKELMKKKKRRAAAIANGEPYSSDSDLDEL